MYNDFRKDDQNNQQSWEINDDIESIENAIHQIKNKNKTKLRSLKNQVSQYYNLDLSSENEEVQFNKKPKNYLLSRLMNIEISTSENNLVYNVLGRSLLSFEIHDKEIKLIVNSSYIKIFDYISIHQGVLDKVYNTFKHIIKDKKQFFGQIITQFYDIFSPLKLVIHTGRGKPNYLNGMCSYRSLSDLDYALQEPKEILIDYFKGASHG